MAEFTTRLQAGEIVGANSKKDDKEHPKKTAAGATLPADIALAIRLLRESATAFSTNGLAFKQLAEAIASTKTAFAFTKEWGVIGEILAQNAEMAQMVAEQRRVLESLQKSLGAAPLFTALPIPASVIRVQQPLAVVLRAHGEEIANLEDRVGALEVAVADLKKMLDDPELPEEYKAEIRRLLKDLQDQEYIR